MTSDHKLTPEQIEELLQRGHERLEASRQRDKERLRRTAAARARQGDPMHMRLDAATRAERKGEG